MNIGQSIIIKNINEFCLKPLMKTKRHISLAHLHLLSIKQDSLLNFYQPVTKLCLCFVGLTERTDSQYYLSSFFCSQTLPLKNSFLFLPTRPVLLKKSLIMCRHSSLEKLAHWANHSSFINPARPIGKINFHVPAGPSPGSCRPLAQLASVNLFVSVRIML